MPNPKETKGEKKLLRSGLDPSETGKLGGRPLEWTEEKATELGEELIAWLKASDDNVFFERFLVMEKGLSPQIISKLTSNYDSFRETKKLALKIQEMKLAQLLLTTKGNPGGPIFCLKNNGHGWTDKTETKVESVNYNYSPEDLRAKTQDELMDLLNSKTNTTR